MKMNHCQRWQRKQFRNLYWDAHYRRFRELLLISLVTSISVTWFVGLLQKCPLFPAPRRCCRNQKWKNYLRFLQELHLLITYWELELHENGDDSPTLGGLYEQINPFDLTICLWSLLLWPSGTAVLPPGSAASNLCSRRRPKEISLNNAPLLPSFFLFFLFFFFTSFRCIGLNYILQPTSNSLKVSKILRTWLYVFVCVFLPLLCFFMFYEYFIYVYDVSLSKLWIRKTLSSQVNVITPNPTCFRATCL